MDSGPAPVRASPLRKCAMWNDDGERVALYFKCFAKNAMLRGQAMSALVLS